MASDTIAMLESALGGTVVDLHRLSGGSSRSTSSFDLVSTDTTRPLILQQYRSDGVGRAGQVLVEAELLTAARARGVPVAEVVAIGEPDENTPGWLVVERLEGESIPRRILRDETYAAARTRLSTQWASALASIHSIEPDEVRGLAPSDPLARPLDFLDATGECRPVLEIAVRWLERHRTASDVITTVHGDFRMGNFLVDTSGLVAVLDWELAHRGDPAEDIGWLCARAWRFGGSGRVGGLGDLDDFLEAYELAGGAPIDADQVHWWEVYATLKWAVICALQAAAHLSGAHRSLELAAIGRRVCESEWDLAVLLGARVDADDIPEPFVSAASPFGRPSATELLDATADYLESTIADHAHGPRRFDAMVARNVVRIVGREMTLGPSIRARHEQRLSRLGYVDDRDLARDIRDGTFDDDLDRVVSSLAASTYDQLLVAHPSYVERDDTVL